MAASFLGSHTSFLPLAMRLRYDCVILFLISAARIGSSCSDLMEAAISVDKSVVAMPQRASKVCFLILSRRQCLWWKLDTMSLTAGMAFSHFHRCLLVSFLMSQHGHALVSYIVYFSFKVFIIRSMLLMDFTRYVLSIEVFDELKLLFIFPSRCRTRRVVCQSTSCVLAVSIIKPEV